MKNILLILLTLLAVLSGAGVESCSPGGSSIEPSPLTVAYSPFESTALLWIARDRGFFEKNGLNISLKKYDTGAGSLDGVLRGEADLAFGVTEFPVVRRVLDKSDVVVLGAAAKVQQQYFVGRKDRGIEKPSDLRGKRIGTTLGTIAEFYLGRFLETNGLSIKDITEVDLKTPLEWENAVADGTVDGIVTAEPYADLAAVHLGANAVKWPVQGGLSVYGLVVSSGNWAPNNQKTISRFIKALAAAEDYSNRNAEQAKLIVGKDLGMDGKMTASVWSRDLFALSIDQSLLNAMELEARWLLSNNLTTATKVPNFLENIDSTSLKAVKPEAVNLVGK